MSIYERIRTLCKQKGVTITGVEADLGFARGSLSKIDKNKPSADRVSRLSEYLGVSAQYLLTGEEKDDAPSYYMNEDARELAEFLFHNPEYKVLFDASRHVKKEDIEFVKKMIDMARRDTDDTGC